MNPRTHHILPRDPASGNCPKTGLTLDVHLIPGIIHFDEVAHDEFKPEAHSYTRLMLRQIVPTVSTPLVPLSCVFLRWPDGG